MNIRNILNDEILNNNHSDVDQIVLCGSGGIDSASVALSLKDCGLKFSIASFGFQDFDSEDVLGARRLAVRCVVPFKKIDMPVSDEILYDSVINLMRIAKVKGKAQIECLLPFYFLFSKFNTKTYFYTGIGADTNYCLSKKCMMHYNKTPGDRQRYVEESHANPDMAQRLSRGVLARFYGHVVKYPYLSDNIRAYLAPLTWKEMHKPRQKEIVRMVYPELDAIKVKNHTNLQLGNSRIAERIGRACHKKHGHGKSAVSAYNQMYKEMYG